LKTETITALRPDGHAGSIYSFLGAARLRRWILVCRAPALRLGTLQTNGRRAKRGQFQ
jgi:hypothetical protein